MVRKVNQKHESIKKHKYMLEILFQTRKERPLECYKCRALFFENCLHYKRHVWSHKQKKIFLCEHCDKIFYHKLALKEHMPDHREKLKENCLVLLIRLSDDILEEYKNRRSVKTKTKFLYEIKEYICPICDAVRCSKSEIITHATEEHCRKIDSSLVSSNLDYYFFFFFLLKNTNNFI